MVASQIKNLYTTIFSQASSQEEGLLAVGNSEGDIIVYDSEVLASRKKSSTGDNVRQQQIISTEFGPIYSLAQTPHFCISGSNGVISGWRWSDFKDSSCKPAFNIKLDSDKTNLGIPEVNNLTLDTEKDVVYAACGDWQTRGYDLETGKLTLKLEGHEDYVHDVAVSENLLVTCGEDGAVLSWDPRAGTEPQIKLKPHTEAQLNRPSHGKFISSVDIENDWLICGGGPRAAIFHLRSMAVTTLLPPSEFTINLTKFTKQSGGDRGGIIIAGLMPAVYMSNMAGEITAQIPSCSNSVYTAHISGKPMVMTFGGMSSKLDVCLNLNYRDYTFSTL